MESDLLEWNLPMSELRRRRREAGFPRDPDSLETLAMKTMLFNYHFFTGLPALVYYRFHGLINPLKTLPDACVQSLLKYLKVDAQKLVQAGIIPRENRTDFVMKLLMNPHITKINLDDIRLWSGIDKNVNVNFLVKKCCKVTSFELSREVDYDSEKMPQVPYIQLSQWRNLKFLSMRGYFCKDETLNQLQKRLPHLEVLEFSVLAGDEGSDYFSMEAVEYMSQMENLKCLYVSAVLVKHGHEACFASEVLAIVAGGIPNLEQLHYQGAVESFSFLDVYDRFSRGKPLNIVELTLLWIPPVPFQALEIFQRDESEQYLTVEQLTFVKSLPPKVLRLLNEASLPDVKSLCFKSSAPKLIYSMVKKFGPQLTELEILGIDCSDADETFNLYQVLAACPNLEIISIYYVHEDFMSDPKHNITPLYFQNVILFDYAGMMTDSCVVKKDHEMHKIFKMYLLGAEKLHDEVLLLFSSNQYFAVLEAMEENPKSLNKVKKLVLDVKAVDANSLLQAFEICRKLTIRSPYLEKITFQVASKDQYDRVMEGLVGDDQIYEILFETAKVGLCIYPDFA